MQKKRKISGQVIEGMESCESICKLAERHKVELPILNSVMRILSGHNVDKIIASLLSRPLQFEKVSLCTQLFAKIKRTL